MFIKSLNLNFKDRSTRKISAIIIFAIIVAIALILITSISVLSQKDIIREEGSKENFFDIKSYHTKFNVKTISNKNTNTYEMEEYYLKDEAGKESFKFTTKNSDGTTIVYTISDGILSIKNEKEKSEYTLSNYLVNKENLLSISTFIELYNDMIEYTKNNSDKNIQSFKVENINKDDTIRYKITFNNTKDDCKICKKYEGINNTNIYVQKVELVYNTVLEKPIEYIAYSKDNKAFIDINFINFDRNIKIDKKIFAF